MTLQSRHSELVDRYELIGGGIGVHWPDVNEDIALGHILLGLRSGETEQSLEQWRKERAVQGELDRL